MPRSTLSGWNAAVAVSAALVLAAVITVGIYWVVSRQSATVAFSAGGRVSVVDLQLSSGEATIAGTSSSHLQVSGTNDYSFGHPPRQHRWLAHGVLHIISRCPRIILGTCSASYELAVPDGVAVDVSTRHGNVRMTGIDSDATVTTGSGNVDVEAFCGFHLHAISGSGNITVSTACAPETLDLRTGSGDVTALVPPGHYRIVAHSGVSRERITGLTNDPSAPYTIEANSGTGSVGVKGGL